MDLFEINDTSQSLEAMETNISFAREGTLS